MIKKLLCCWMLLYGTIVHTVIAEGDTIGSATTFQFSIGSGIYDAAKQQLWTLSGQATSAFSPEIQSYGIAYTPFVSIDGSPALITYPYLTTKALISSTNDEGAFVIGSAYVANPLLGKSFSSVSFLGSFLTVVESLQPRYVSLIQSAYFDDGALYGKSSPDGISIINVLDLGQDYEATTIAGSGLGALFIAQAQGPFGSAGDFSRIAFASTSTSYVAINGKNTTCTAMKQQAYESITLATPVLTAQGNDLSEIGSSVVMYPSSTTAMQMYVGLDITAGIEENTCAVGLFTAQAQASTETTTAAIAFRQVMPNNVALQGLLTPISTNTNQNVVISNITTTQTSTGLSYLITSRSSNAGQQSIYAMPMVTMATNNLDNGKIAKFNSVQQNFKIIGTTYRTQGFSDVIDDANEIDIAGSQEVINRIEIGGGSVPLAAGQKIEQLTAQGDAVYITIKEPFGPESTPGMFKSQALFDVQGRIMSWSPWQRVGGTDDQMLFAIKNRYTDATMYVSGADSNTIQQTTWNKKTILTSFITSIYNNLPVVKGGVQGIFPISNQTPGLANFTLAVATGNQTVVIGQTGTLDGDENVVIDDEQASIVINEQQNLSINSVVAATFAHSSLTDYNWFFMGGDTGLAVLSDDTTGILFESELTSLDQLTAQGISSKVLGNFKYVKKVISSDNFLYILTTSGVYRIALTAANFTSNNFMNITIETVITASTIDTYTSCLDMLIDNNLMLLGTTAGLYSLNLTESLPIDPVGIEIPGGLSTVCRLNTVSSLSNFNENFYNRSNLYVLTINYGLQQARLNRFVIRDGVVNPIEDQLLEGQNGPLLVFDFMNNNIFIDGSLGFVTSYRVGITPPSLKYLEYTLQAGKSSTQVLLQGSVANISIASLLNSLAIAGVARDYASGCLMLGFDYGLLTDSSK